MLFSGGRSSNLACLYNRLGNRGPRRLQQQRGARRNGRRASVPRPPTHEPNRLAFGARRLRETRTGDAQFLRAIPEDLRWRPSAEKLQSVPSSPGRFRFK